MFSQSPKGMLFSEIGVAATKRLIYTKLRTFHFCSNVAEHLHLVNVSDYCEWGVLLFIERGLTVLPHSHHQLRILQALSMDKRVGRRRSLCTLSFLYYRKFEVQGWCWEVLSLTRRSCLRALSRWSSWVGRARRWTRSTWWPGMSSLPGKCPANAF